MKDSGIEFIGEIPKYWGVIPIQRVFDEVKNPNKVILKVMRCLLDMVRLSKRRK